MQNNLIFVGENRSPTAIARGWTWKDGHLAARPLFEALEAMGLDPSKQTFVNLFVDGPSWRAKGHTTKLLRCTTATIIALGQKVSRGLESRGIPHVVVTHPAARGRIRKTSRYRAHVRDVLEAVAA